MFRRPVPVVFALLLTLCTGFVRPARAESPAELQNPLQTRGAWVLDNANVVDEALENRLNNQLTALEKETTVQMAVVTVRDLGGRNVEEFANELFNLWRIGQQGKDNGILLLAAITDRKMRLEVGYGLEGTLPDGRAGEILRRDMVPPFKAGNYGAGLYAATRSVVAAVGGTVTPDGQGAPAPAARIRRDFGGGSAGPVAPPDQDFTRTERGDRGERGEPQGDFIFTLVTLFMLGLPLFGLAAIVAGIVWWMRRPPRCPQCRTAMTQLPDVEESAFLTAPQKFEQQIGSRDYRVWRCPSCSHEKVTEHNKFFSGFADCNRCGNRTAREDVQTLRVATEWSQGLEQVTHTCLWPECRHTETRNRSTPRIQRVRSGSGAGFGIGSSGGWGGGSGSSGRSGGFGGGRSGGGGASSGW